MIKKHGCIKGLGEVSIRVNHLELMHKFYEEVIGLEILMRKDTWMNRWQSVMV